MAGLVLELQGEAMDEKVPASAVLRKALAVSRKLGLKDMESWLSEELNGYAPGAEVPEYRKFQGSLKVWNPYHGWQPLYFAKPEDSDLFSKTLTRQSVSEIEELLAKGESAYESPLGAKAVQMLMKGMEIELRPALHIPRTALIRVTATVRHRILDWALDLENRGVIGERMAFSQAEKENAREAGTIYQIQNQTIVHGMHGSQIQQGTHGSAQSYEAAQLDTETILALVADIRATVQGSSLGTAAATEIEGDLATIEAQAKAPKPKRAFLAEAAKSVRTVLESAAGGALGNAVPALPGLLDNLSRLVT